MKRERVDSEALRSVGYDPGTRVLELEFSSGVVYRYFDVPMELHASLMTADSHGEFFIERIRDAGFEYERID